MIRIVSAGAAVVALAAATGAAFAAEGTVRVGTDVDAGTLDPRVMRDTTAYRVANLIYDGLVELDAGLQPQPGLAESWDNPSATEFVFHLRDGVTFHDGSALTAEDVVFTIETILDPAMGSRWSSLFTPIESVEAVDDLTVKVTLSQPYAPLLSYLDIGIVPSDLVESGHDIGSEPVGTGPMRLDNWVRGSEIDLVPNQDWWGETPTVDAINFIVVPDNTARAQAFEAGDLDLIQSPLSPPDIRRLAEDESFESAIMGGVGVTYINFNANDPLVGDPGMRRALSMLVDQASIVDGIYEGVDVVATSVLLPSWASYAPDIAQPVFNPEAAVEELARLGWTDSDGDGFLDKDGTALTITLTTHSEDPNRIQAVEYIQNVMRQSGIDAQVGISDWPAFSTDVQESRHQVALLGWLNLVDPDRLLYGQLRTGGALNWGGYSNPTVDEALDAGRTALTAEERAAAYQAAAAQLAEDVPYYIVSYQGYQVFWSPETVEGYEPNVRGMMRSLLH